MLQKQFIYWWQKWLRPIVVRVAVKIVVMICLTVGVLGIWGSNTPVSYAEAKVPTSVAVNTPLASTTKRIQDKQIALKPTALHATVYRTPECNCCGGWIDHLKAQGFEIKSTTYRITCNLATQQLLTDTSSKDTYQQMTSNVCLHLSQICSAYQFPKCL